MSAARNAPRWARWTLVVGLVISILAGATAFGAQLLLDRWEGAVSRDTLLAPGARTGATPGSTPTGPSPPAPAPGPGASVTAGTPPPTAGPPAGPGTTGSRHLTGPLNYLVVGSDLRVDNPGAGERADAIVIVHVPDGLRSAYLVSVPRDLRVPVPGHGLDKINHAFAYGDAPLLSTTLNDLTGLAFDGAAILDFGGFRRVVDELGGVEVCLPRPVRSIHTDALFPAGCQHLTGAEALDLARQRYDLPAGDLDRGRNHQRLIRAMARQVRHSGLLSDPVRLDRVIRAVGESLTVDTGGVPLPELALALRHLRPDRITGITLPSHPQVINGVSYVLAHRAADGLYRALRDADLATWVGANPRWRNE